ncbi:alpha/beta fold hydrolase [Maribacter sp.]|uniref:alpha/beta hydrolase family protein n=1 Tax=Maribacter sp. TaxID=1897614 RepID=UPI0025BE2D5D|nr:alpha/beta fold hydrolase [Maribacter sp.]
MKVIEIPSSLGSISASLHENTKADTVLIIASATGVKQQYYSKFATYAQNNGVTVITFDYIGIGSSLNKPIKTIKTNAADWGRNDIESILQYVINHYPKSRKVILGHSIGGQLIGLAKSSNTLDKIILVAAQSGYWKYWKGMGKVRMWLNWYVLFPFLITTFGYLNAKKLSGMENLPKNVADQWRNWGTHSNYIFSDPSINETHYHAITANIAAYSIADDTFAPKEAVQWMTAQYKNAKSKSYHLRPCDYQANKIGHFGVFRDKFKATIWKTILNEICSS